MMTTEEIVVTVDSDLEDLIPGFLENRRRDAAALQAALDEGRIDTLRSIGHSLKGVGGGYGFHELSKIGAEIENHAMSGELSGIGGLITRMHDYLNRVIVRYG